MSSFRFIHAADLHLGSSFQGLAVKDPEIAGHFADATRKAFSALVLRAIEDAADFVVVAGDVYDREWKDSSIGLFFNREVARLDRAGIPVFLLKGNHDAESVITKGISLPDTVAEFSTRKPTTLQINDLKVALHGQGFAERSASDNLALSYPPPVPGWFNIGVLHTSLSGRPPHANYAPCSTEDLRARGYDYWALGHVHEFEIVARDPAIVYPGNLQGRSIRETGTKGAVIVTVEDGRVAAIERVIVDQARWCDVTLDIGGYENLAAILTGVGDAIAGPVEDAEDRLVALRLRLTGESALCSWIAANRPSVADEVQAACHRLHPDIWLEKVKLRITPPALRSGVGAERQSLDLGALLDNAQGDPEFHKRTEAIILEIAARLPAGLGARDVPLGEEIAALVDEARNLLIQRAGEGG